MHKLVLIVLALLSPTAAYAAEPEHGVAPMSIAGPAAAPAGFVDMCRRHAEECGTDRSSPATAIDGRLSPTQWRSLFRSSLRGLDDRPASIAPRDRLRATRIATPARSRMAESNGILVPAPAAPEEDTFWKADRRLDLFLARPTLLSTPMSENSPLPHPEPAPAPAPAPAPVHAQTAGDTPAPTLYTDATTVPLHQIKAVNSAINRSIRRASDWQTFGRADFWAVPEDGATSGDCEDFVLAKRRALISEGVDRGALSIALVRTPRGEMHAVLLVATTAGEVVLDNLSPFVVPWSETSYTWLKRQLPGTGQWALVAEASDRETPGRLV